MSVLSNDKEKYVHGVFTAIAHRYDLLNTLLSLNLDRYWRRYAAVRTGLGKGGRALDACCGTGMLTLELAKLAGSAGKVVGADFCRPMLDRAAAKLAGTAYQPVVELVEANVLSLPYADDSFDCATIGFALRNVPDITATLAELRRVVRPGGRVVSLDLAKPETPGFKQLYYLYFERLVPLVGKLGVGADGPYRWLPESLRQFPHQADIREMFAAAGLNQAAYQELTGGIVAVHVGVK
ncbi:MAG TPA: ubiquinone/menaquinone biosynthesis methyltransferase [Selenomonadales bacterium]|nr:ubiquinone/menaquinone biosynthesis methyltransferase [Selenomonadales bacterium]